MRATLAFALLAAAAVAGVAGAVYGGHAFVSTVEVLAPLGVATVLAAHAVAGGRERLGGLRRQLAVVGLLIGAQLAIAVVLFIATVREGNPPMLRVDYPTPWPK